MALITILMYFNIDELDLPVDFPILKGDYKKFNVEWYKVVGSTIFVTMVLQIFAPNCAYFGMPTLRWMLRCWDRKFGCNEKITKQLL